MAASYITTEDGTVRGLCRVTYRMTDMMGVVYYGNYMEFFEIGRNELFRAHELDYRDMEKDGLMLPCTHASCDYIAPARFNDLLEIDTRISALTKAKVHFRYEIRRGGTGELLARGVTHHVYLSPEGRLRRLTPEWWTRMERLSGHVLPTSEKNSELASVKGTNA